ncbi:MAG: hypothetical protein ACRD2J_02935 [Thermoanaerobaculia bacterium]
MTIRLRSAARAALVTLLALPSLLLAEFPLSGTARIGPMVGFKSAPLIAATDAGLLVFWNDAGGFGGARLDARGTWLGPLSDQPQLDDISLHVAVAVSTGPNVFVAAQRGTKLELLQFDADGELESRQVVDEFGEQQAPAIAWNGTDLLLTYIHRDAVSNVYGVSITAAGEIGRPFVIGEWDPFSQAPSVTASGDAFFVAWGAPSGFMLARIVDGFVMNVEPIESEALLQQVSIGASGGRLLVTGLLRAGEIQGRIYDVLDPVGPWIPISDRLSHAPIVESASSGWIVFYGKSEMPGVWTLRARAISSSLVPGDERVVASFRAPMVKFDVTTRGGDIAAAWSDLQWFSTLASTDIRVAVAPSSGPLPILGTIISLDLAPQVDPIAAFGAGRYLAVWSERNSLGSSSLRYRIFDVVGDAVTLELQVPGVASQRLAPAAAFDGASFLLAWFEKNGDEGSIVAMRMALDGTMIGGLIPLFSGPAPLPNVVRAPAVAWSGSAWIVAAPRAEGGIEMVRVSPGGVVLDAEPAVLTNEIVAAPRIACSGSACLVTWIGPSNDPCPPITCLEISAVYAARVGSGLELLDPTPLRLTSEGSDVAGVDVSWNGSDWMVSWSGPAGRRVSPAGVVLDAPRGRSISFDDVAIAPAAGGWHVVWTRHNLGEQPGTEESTLATGVVTAGFGPADPQQRALLATTTRTEASVDLAAAPRPLAVFSRAEPHLTGGVRVYGAFLDELKPFSATVTLQASRDEEARLVLTWQTDADPVYGARVLSCSGTVCDEVATVGPDVRSIALQPEPGSTPSFVVHVETIGGWIASNSVPAGSRRRLVSR